MVYYKFKIGDTFYQNGKIYEVKLQEKPWSCDNCDLNDEGVCINTTGFCTGYNCENIEFKEIQTSGNDSEKVKSLILPIPYGYEITENKGDGFIILKPIIPKEKKWEDFGEVNGYFIDSESSIHPFKGSANHMNYNIYPNKKLAESALALSQLLQWRDKVNDGWFPDWTDCNEDKCAIYCKYNEFIIGEVSIYSKVLTFKSKEIAEQFLKDHKTLLKIAKPLF